MTDRQLRGRHVANPGPEKSATLSRKRKPKEPASEPPNPRSQKSTKSVAAERSTRSKSHASTNSASIKDSPRLANALKRKRRSAPKATALLPTPPKEPTPPQEQQSEEETEEDNDFVHDGEGEELEDNDMARKKKRRRQQSSDDEDSIIDPSATSMWELAAPRAKKGKISDMEKAMQKINWKEVKQRQKAELYQMAMNRRKPADSQDDEDADEGKEVDKDLTIDEQIDRNTAKQKAKGKRKGTQLKNVGGEIVIDEDSRRVDRHAEANEDMGDLVEYEEQDITKRFNAHTFQNFNRRVAEERLPTKDRWDKESTDKFFDCLRRFGTNFEIISKMFPGKTRRHIKSKFVKEERQGSERVDRALRGEDTTPGEKQWDMEWFKSHTGLVDTDFKDPKKIEEELEKYKKERMVDIEKQREETRKEERQKEAAKAAGIVDESEEETDEGAEGEAVVGAEKERVVISVPDDEASSMGDSEE